MIRFAGMGIIGLLLLGLWIYCVVDVIISDSSVVRNLPKPLWVMVVILVPTVGSVAWLVLGRPLFVGARPGGGDHAGSSARAQPPPEYRGPEDDPEFWSR